MLIDQTKPNLLIHPNYEKLMLNYDLDLFYNIINIEYLQSKIDSIYPVLCTDETIYTLTDTVLEPYYKNNLKNKSGFKPNYTSYYFDEELPIYKIADRSPRYVIWTEDDPLTVCATHIDRVDNLSLYDAAQRAKDWAYDITKTASIIVFDLDETLIDSENKKYAHADKILDYAREKYDFVVLYSHGSQLHVDECVLQFETVDFDLVLSNNSIDSLSNKNLLYLYNYYPNTIFSSATIVDDSLYNWTPEYNKFIVPFVKHSIKNLLQLL